MTDWAASEEPGPSWVPEWQVDVGHDCVLGIALDDHCFVVLYPQEDGSWRPGTHIPQQVAQFMAGIVVPFDVNPLGPVHSNGADHD